MELPKLGSRRYERGEACGVEYDNDVDMPDHHHVGPGEEAVGGDGRVGDSGGGERDPRAPHPEATTQNYRPRVAGPRNILI